MGSRGRGWRFPSLSLSLCTRITKKANQYEGFYGLTTLCVCVCVLEGMDEGISSTTGSLKSPDGEKPNQAAGDSELGRSKEEKNDIGWIEWLRGWWCVIYECLFQRILASHLQNPLPLPPVNELTCVVTGSTSGIGLQIARYTLLFHFSGPSFSCSASHSPLVSPAAYVSGSGIALFSSTDEAYCAAAALAVKSRIVFVLIVFSLWIIDDTAWQTLVDLTTLVRIRLTPTSTLVSIEKKMLQCHRNKMHSQIIIWSGKSRDNVKTLSLSVCWIRKQSASQLLAAVIFWLYCA